MRSLDNSPDWHLSVAKTRLAMITIEECRKIIQEYCKFSFSHKLKMFTKHSMLVFKEVCYGLPQFYAGVRTTLALWCDDPIGWLLHMQLKLNSV